MSAATRSPSAREPAGLDALGWRLRDRYLPFVLAAITVVTFLPVLRNGFVGWDDDYNLTDNPGYRGLGWAQLRWMFTSAKMANYVPVTWLTFGADYLVWGMNPAGYHLTSVLFHAANGVLLYLLARRLLARASALAGANLTVAAATAALVFAIHPLRVESVAWLSERRDVVAGLFCLLTILLYLRAAEAEGPIRRRLLAGSVASYALAVLSKASVVTLPAALVILDVYPLGRLPLHPRRWLEPPARRLWAEKVPYLLLGLGGALTAYRIHAGLGKVTVLSAGPAVARILYSLWFYPLRTLVPLGLSPMYELPESVDPLAPPFLAAGVGVVGLTSLLVLLARRWPAGLATWACYAVMLVPVTGGVQAGSHLVADRYAYLPGLGWALLLGAGTGVLARSARAASRRAIWCRLGVVAIGLWLAALGVHTWRQVQVWRDTLTLWEHALRVDPDCAFCHDALGVWLVLHGHPLAGAEHVARATALRPTGWQLHWHLGEAYEQLGRRPEAITEYRRELALFPRSPEARTALGRALIESGQPADGLAELERGVALGADSSSLRATLGLALRRLGRPREAVPHFLTAVALAPQDGLPRVLLAETYLELGEPGLAREQYDALRRIDPVLAEPLGRRLQER